MQGQDGQEQLQLIKLNELQGHPYFIPFTCHANQWQLL